MSGPDPFQSVFGSDRGSAFSPPHTTLLDAENGVQVQVWRLDGGDPFPYAPGVHVGPPAVAFAVLGFSHVTKLSTLENFRDRVFEDDSPMTFGDETIVFSNDQARRLYVWLDSLR